MTKGVLLLALVALSACVVYADDMDTSLLAIEDTLHDTPVRQSQRQFMQERVNSMRFAQAGQRGFFGKLGKAVKGAAGLVKSVAKGAIKGALKGGAAGALLGGVKAGLKAIAKKGGKALLKGGKALLKGASKLAKNVGQGIKAGAKLVNLVGDIRRKGGKYLGGAAGLAAAGLAGAGRLTPALSSWPNSGAGIRPKAVKYYGLGVKPRMNRLSGAASTYAPRDQGCAICQFLVQRTQQDFAAFQAAAKKGGSGKGEEATEEEFLQLKSAAQAAQAAQTKNDNKLEAVLLQLGEEEGTENEQQESDEFLALIQEEEEEEEAEEEEEEEEEDVSLISTASEAQHGLSAQEQQELTEVLEETHDEKVADAVEQAVAGEHVSIFGAQIDEAQLANEEIDEALLEITEEEKEELVEALAKSDAIVAELNKSGKTDLTEEEKAELQSLLDEDVSEVEQSATYLVPNMVENDSASEGAFSFLETGAKAKNYARVLYKAEEQSPAPEMVTTSFLSLGGITKQSFDLARQQRTSVPSTPRRFRLGDVLNHRPVWNRFDPTVAPHPNPERQKARIMFQHMLQYTYDRLEGYCSTRLPEQFFPFCAPMLRKYRLIAEGIRYGDRPDQICMRAALCPKGSYVRSEAHAVFAH